jgi:hypothetical protein
VPAPVGEPVEVPNWGVVSPSIDLGALPGLVPMPARTPEPAYPAYPAYPEPTGVAEPDAAGDGSSADDGSSSDRPPPFGFGFSGLPVTYDRVPLTQRRRLAQAAPAPSVGDAASFWVNNGTATLEGDSQRTARLHTITPHAYFWVDSADEATLDAAKLAELADAFERQIRPRVTALFGEEANPGIDGDPHLYMVLSSVVGSAPGRSGMMGYFWPRDPVEAGGTGNDLRQHANQKEVLFLSPALMDQPDVTGYGTLAHEYQHLIMFSAKSRIDGTPRTEDTWLDEGFSMLAMDVAGYGLQHGDAYVSQEVADFQADPAAYSLTDWTHNPHGYSYGLSYLFVRYLVDRLGPGVIREVQTNAEPGVSGLDKVLRRYGSDFPSFFLDWAQANRPGASASERGYAWFDPQGTYGGVTLKGILPTTADAPGRETLRPWGLSFLEISGLADRPRELTLGAASAPLVVLDPAKALPPTGR